MAGRRRRLPSAEESALWRAAMTGVAPLPGRASPVPEPAEVSAARPPAGRTAAVVATRTIGAGLDAATERRLRQGRIPVDRKLDLHGLSEAQAHRRLLAALPAAQADGVRLVLIVTGKGSRDGRTGVLRRSLGRWLEEPGLASLVLSSRPAPPRLGGEGARQVLLRRRRD